MSDVIDPCKPHLPTPSPDAVQTGGQVSSGCSTHPCDRRVSHESIPEDTQPGRRWGRWSPVDQPITPQQNPGPWVPNASQMGGHANPTGLRMRGVWDQAPADSFVDNRRRPWMRRPSQAALADVSRLGYAVPARGGRSHG
jgi:hypothetical protein